MSKRKGLDGGEHSPSPPSPSYVSGGYLYEERVSSRMILDKGFYIVDGNGAVRTREVTKGKPGSPERATVTEPIRFRTFGGALDGLALAGDNCAILGVTVDNFAWGE